MNIKILCSIITFGIIFSWNTTNIVNKPKEQTFRIITQASYSPKRSGELTRKEALMQNLELKKIFNKKGVLIEYWRYEGDGTIYQKTKLTKNKNGKLIKSSTYNKEGNLKSYTKTILDENENIVEYKSYDINDILKSKQNNTHDSRGNVISMSNTNMKSNRTFKTTSEYNSDNLLIKEIDFKPDGSIKDTRVFKYDENGNEIESELTRPNGDYTKFISEYDNLNNMTVQNWYDDTGKQKHQTSFTYVYDDKNNWITKKRYSNGELGYVWERQIEYY